MSSKKLSVFLGITLAIGLLVTGLASATERCVLLELFTDTYWGACANAETALDSVVKNDFSPGSLAVIRNYLSGSHFHEDGTDDRFFSYPPWYDGSYYTPTVWVDGVDSMVASASASWWQNKYNSMVNARLPVASPLAIDLQIHFPTKGDSGTVNVEVVATGVVPSDTLNLRLAIIESNLSWDGETWGQVLRKYFPDATGISFNIAEGDTFTHSEDFYIKAYWVNENCKIVAFVQHDPAHEVLQSVQSLIVLPVPEEVSDLTVNLVENDLRLDWSAVVADTNGNPLTVDQYQVYRDALPFFDPGSDPFTSTTDTYYVDDTGVVGDTGTNYFYWVTAKAGFKESAESNGAGEFDRDVLTGK